MNKITYSRGFNIVKFSNGMYFNGVKGKLIRETHNILDAKRLDNGILSERDREYLEDSSQSRGYKIITVNVQIEEFSD